VLFFFVDEMICRVVRDRRRVVLAPFLFSSLPSARVVEDRSFFSRPRERVERTLVLFFSIKHFCGGA